jgi:hypothetical protein
MQRISVWRLIVRSQWAREQATIDVTRMAYASPSKQEGDVLRVAVLQPEDAGGDAGARSASICLAWYRRCRRLASPGG